MKTLLVVEDDDINRDMLLEVLSMHKEWRVLAVEHAAALEKVLEVVKVDLVLLDVLMFGLDGLEAYRLLRKHPLGQNVPVVFVTANKDKVMAAHLDGTYGLVEKPFHLDALVGEVNACLAFP